EVAAGCDVVPLEKQVRLPGRNYRERKRADRPHVEDDHLLPGVDREQLLAPVLTNGALAYDHQLTWSLPVLESAPGDYVEVVILRVRPDAPHPSDLLTHPSREADDLASEVFNWLIFQTGPTKPKGFASY